MKNHSSASSRVIVAIVLNLFSQMNTNFVMLLLLAALGSSVVSQLEPGVQQKIDELIQDEYFTKGRISALVLAIVKDGKVTNGYGYRDIENTMPPDSSTLFYIGSISKVILSTLI